MANSKVLCALVVLLGLCALATAQTKPMFCYWGSWSAYRPGNGNFDVHHIDPFLCTHYVYSFFGIQTDGSIRIIDPWMDLDDDGGRGSIRRFNEMKNQNPNLITLAAVGGWNEGSHNFSVVARDPALRARFAQTSLDLVLQFGFDGLDMDWEYPAQREGSDPVDRANFIFMLQDLRNALAPHGKILTAAVAAAEFSAAISYDIPAMSAILDYILLMTYDFNGAWGGLVGHNAPMRAGPADQTAVQLQLNVNAAVNYWLNQGAAREKLVLGIPLYGNTFTLANPANFLPGSAHVGGGTPGIYTQQAGFLGYNEFCVQQMTGMYQMLWEPVQEVPFGHIGNQWVGIDTVDSVYIKGRYAMTNNLGGTMVWSIETDDFLGICGPSFALMHSIRNSMN